MVETISARPSDLAKFYQNCVNEVAGGQFAYNLKDEIELNSSLFVVAGQRNMKKLLLVLKNMSLINTKRLKTKMIGKYIEVL